MIFKTAAFLLFLPALALAGRSVEVVPIETQAALSDNAGESITLKCSIVNPSNDTQSINISYYTPASASVTGSVVNSNATPGRLARVVLPPNASYSVLFCQARDVRGDCEETPQVAQVPLRVTITVEEDRGYLVGNCVSHFSQNSVHHRSTAVGIAGGQPF